MRTTDRLPDWRDAWALVRQASAAVRPPRRVSVSEAAERHIRFRRTVGYNGPWRNDMAPHLVEPLDLCTSRAVDEIVVMGPAQFGKSALMLAVAAHAIMYRPADILIFQPTKEAAKDFKARRIDRELISWGEGLAAQVGADRSDDTAFSTAFRSGMRIDVQWPTVTTLSSRPVPIVFIDERDRLSDDIGGEGDPAELGRRRTTTFAPEGLLGVLGSPSRPDGTGIVARWRRGWRCFRWLPCQHCGHWWPAGFDEAGKPTLADLYLPPDCADPEEARAKAGLMCPACGAVHTEAERLAACGAGRWLAEGERLEPDGAIGGRLRRGRVATFWLSGQANTMKALPDLAAELVQARQTMEDTGEETGLQTVMNTGFGFPYVRQGDGAAPLDSGDVERRKGGHVLGAVPEGVRFLVATVDTQGNRFEAAIWGYNEGAEAWLVDRFAVLEVDGREIAPGSQPEVWPALLPRVLGRRYPLAADPSRGLSPAVMAVDIGGLDGATENAKAFWRAARRRGVDAARLMLVKGATTATAPILAAPSYEHVKGKPNKAGVRWYMVGVSQAKDTAANRLRRTEAGPGAIHLPSDLSRRHADELTAEQKVDGVWTRVRRRNETWDLLVYSIAAYARLRPAGIDWGAPPPWAVPVPMADPLEFSDAAEDAEAPEDEAPSPAPAPAPAADPFAPRRADPFAPPADPFGRPAPSRPARAGGFVRNW